MRALHAFGGVAAPALALLASWRAGEPTAPWIVGAAAAGAVLLGRAIAGARRRPSDLVLRDGELVVDGAPVNLRTAWLGPGWLVVRGVRSGARFRVSLFAAEVSRQEFARLRAFCVAELPRVNPLRVAGRRARR